MVGEHIRILKDGRWVHAIDCGDETVLHLAEQAPPPRVRRAYRPEFVAGAASVEVVTHRERTFPSDEVVRRAYSRASDPVLAAMFPDSEAFVEWCLTGRIAAPRNVALEVPGVPSVAERARATEAVPSAKPKSKPVGKAAAKKQAVKRKAAVKAKPAVKAKAAVARKATAKPKRAAKAKAKAASKYKTGSRSKTRTKTKTKLKTR